MSTGDLRRRLSASPWSVESEREAMEHGMCGGKTRRGTTCTHIRGYKTDHRGFGKCTFHTGSSPNGKKAAEEERVMSEIALLMEAERILTDDPVSGLAEAERRARTMARVLDKVVSNLDEWWGENSKGETVPHVAVDLLGEWNDKNARTSKLAIDAGLDERRQASIEAQGQMLADVLRLVFVAVQNRLIAEAVSEEVVKRVWSEHLPGIVRHAIGEATGEA